MPAVSHHPTTRHESKSYRLNAKTWARKFNARLLEPGLVSYEDQGCGKALLRKETLDRCIHSFEGCPIIVRQNQKGRYIHGKPPAKEVEEIGHGSISRVYYNESDGWWYGEGMVDTDEAAKAIKEVGLGSVAYHVNEADEGGTWHDIKYHEEIKDFSGEHLAIVNNPRYEEATIRLNAKNTKNMSMFKWFKKSASRENAGGDDAAKKAAAAAEAAKKQAEADEAARRENATAEEIDGDTEIEITGSDGKPAKVALAKLVEAHNGKAAVGDEISGDSEIHVNGKAVKLNALIEAYNEKVEAREGIDELEEVDEKKKKENAIAEAKKKAEDDKRRENAGAKKPDFFRIVSEASTTRVVRENAIPMDTPDERLARGRSLYGSAVEEKK